jgi:mannose/cellobiose epimerase-like protein (N-acyl-D-glucosamine 2-epimerase family)
MNLASLPDLQEWLLGRAIPLWLRHGIDREAGGFHEALAPDSYACDASFRRLRVVTRQITVFSHAHRHGVPGAAAAAALGIEFLDRHAARPEGGYAWRFDLANRPTDTTRDLYDHAFVLLALASATAVLPAPPLRRKALALLDFLDTNMAHPGGGYVESLPAALPRRQNPHMHLLEALLAAHGAFGEPIFLDRAKRLVGLFLDRLVDPATGALPEFFGDTFRPELVEGSFVTEPGHHAEWVWLLHAFAAVGSAKGGGAKRGGAKGGRAKGGVATGSGVAAVTPARLSRAAAGLLAFADAHGQHPHTHDLIDTVASNGTPVALTARLWPQTERLKAEFLHPGRPPDSRARAVTGLAAYLKPDGLWHERRDAAGHFLPGPSPASTLYHLTIGILTAGAVPN